MQNEFDVNEDGNISDEELQHISEIKRLEQTIEKSESQKRMAWVSIISLIIVTLMLFVPTFPDSRIAIIGDLIGMFYVANASIVGAYMGITAWMTKK